MITRNWLWTHETVNRKITAGIGCDRKAHVTELSLAQWSLSIEYLSSWCISWQSKFSTSQWTRYISIRVILWALIVRARNVAQLQRFQFSIKNLMCFLSYIILILESFGQLGSLLFSTLKVFPSCMTPLLPHVTGCVDRDNMVILFDSQNKLFATDFIPFVFNKANIWFPIFWGF